MYWFILLFPIQKYDYVEHLNSQLQCGIVSSCNEIDLERVQKSALKLILKEKYHNYITALLSLKLTQFKKMFPLNSMKKRNQNRFIVNNAKTERYMRSSIPAIQRLLNKHENDFKKAKKFSSCKCSQ